MSVVLIKGYSILTVLGEYGEKKKSLRSTFFALKHRSAGENQALSFLLGISDFLPNTLESLNRNQSLQ